MSSETQQTVAENHTLEAPQPNELEVRIARERGPQAYPNGGPPADPVMAFVRDRYPGEWLVRIPALGDAGATARVRYKGNRGWHCDCASWKNARQCRHWEPVFVKFGGRPFTVPTAVREWLLLPLPKSASKARSANSGQPWTRCVLGIEKDSSLTVRFLPTGFDTTATRVAFAEIYARHDAIAQVAAFLTNHSAPTPSSTEASSEIRDVE